MNILTRPSGTFSGCVMLNVENYQCARLGGGGGELPKKDLSSPKQLLGLENQLLCFGLRCYTRWALLILKLSVSKTGWQLLPEFPCGQQGYLKNGVHSPSLPSISPLTADSCCVLGSGTRLCLNYSMSRWLVSSASEPLWITRSSPPSASLRSRRQSEYSPCVRQHGDQSWTLPIPRLFRHPRPPETIILCFHPNLRLTLDSHVSFVV